MQRRANQEKVHPTLQEVLSHDYDFWVDKTIWTHVEYVDYEYLDKWEQEPMYLEKSIGVNQLYQDYIFGYYPSEKEEFHSMVSILALKKRASMILETYVDEHAIIHVQELFWIRVGRDWENREDDRGEYEACLHRQRASWV